MGNLGRLSVTRKTGQERFYSDGVELGFDVLDFWQWSASDLISNATRGRLAEYIVARALGVAAGGLRNEWDTYDLMTPSGHPVEVKSAAYVQSWHQEKLSAISFLTRPTRAWDPETNKSSDRPERHADVYVFALLACTDKNRVDPLNISQWQFFVVPTRVLNDRRRSQHSITLKSLRALCHDALSYADLGEVIEEAAAKDSEAIRPSAG